MTRLILGRGAHGELVSCIQRCLAEEGLLADAVDGRYGKNTEAAVRDHQSQHGLTATGQVDDTTWKSATKTDVPSVGERCLQLTAAFEGHRFGLIQGNWDGAWLTWGIIGFTLKHGEFSKIVLEAVDRDPGMIRQCFGDRTDELIAKMRAPAAEKEAWANNISKPSGKQDVVEPWKSAFQALGDQPLVQDIQLRRVNDDYLEPARHTARRYELTSQLGLALCFDIHVQNGGIDTGDATAIERAMTATPPADERALRVIIANAVADNSKFPADVRSRKLTIATGAGTVHGETFAVTSWGLGDFAWETA